MSTPDELLTPAEVSDWLRTPASTLAYWRKSGVGPPFIRLLRRVVYRRGAVDAWLIERTQVSA